MKIVHDIHTHNVFSHCCTDFTASTEAYIKKEQDLGNKIFGLSNHIWDENVKGASYWYKHQTISLAEEACAALKKEREGIRCLFGAEAEYYGHLDRLGMSVEGAKRFDYLLVPHSHLHMRNEVMADYPEISEARQMIASKIAETCPFLAEDTVKTMVGSLKEAHLMKYVPELKTNIGEYTVRSAIDNFYGLIENPVFMAICRTVPTSIAHPFALCGVPNQRKNEYLSLVDDTTLSDCFARAAKIGAYIEINTGAVSEHGLNLVENQLMRVLAIAKAEGCKFTFGTDSHSLNGLEIIKVGNDVCEYLHLTRENIAPYLVEDGIID